MRSIKKALAVLMIFAMVISTITAFDVTSASAKVKSIKVAKKVTVTVGQTKTVKVKVKTTKKTSKKFTVKASKKKIVKVTKKKGKIKIKGLKAGTVKLTIKSKANKKKKKTIKVTVKEADVKMTVKQVDENFFELRFSKAVKISQSNVSVQMKKLKSGNYVQSVKLVSLTTLDNKTYTAVLNRAVYFTDGCMMKFTVTGVNKKPLVQELETYFPERKRFQENVIKVEDNQEIDDHWDIGDYTPSRSFAKVKSVSGIPAGLKYSLVDGTISLKGKLGKTGIFTINFVIEDEKGTTFTLRVVYLSANDYTLTIYCPKTTVGIYENDKDKYVYSSKIHIAGGSGSYTLKAYDNAGIFEDDPYYEDSDYYWDFTSKTIGTKTGIFTVEDNNIANLKATGKAVVETKKTIKIKGKVTTTSGKPIYDAKVRAVPQSYYNVEVSDYDYTDKNGNYEIQVIAGTYNMYAEKKSVYSYVNDKKITANTTQNFKINVFVVNLKSNNPSMNPKGFKDWFNKDSTEQVGYGDTLYFPIGTYDIESEGIGFAGFEYEASAKFTVKGDMTVTATVTGTQLPIATVSEGVNTVRSAKDDKYFKFVPTNTTTYRFYSTDSTGDPLLEVYNENGDSLAYCDDVGDDYDFDLTVNLTKGKTYYLRYYDYCGVDEQMDLHIGTIS